MVVEGDVGKTITGFDVIERFYANPSQVASDFTSFSQHARYAVSYGTVVGVAWANLILSIGRVCVLAIMQWCWNYTFDLAYIY